MKYYFILFFSFSSLFSLAQETISLKLNIFNEFNNENLSFSDVKIINYTTNQKLTKKSNFNGNLEIKLLPEMEYQMFIKRESDSSILIFQEKTIKFNTIGLANGDEIISDIKLRPIFQKGGLQFLEGLNFDIFKYTLNKKNGMFLDNVIDLMQKNPEIELEINGYASCNLSVDDANSVSVERAKAVVSYLTNGGINFERIKAAAWGKDVNVAKCVCEPLKKRDKPCTKNDHLKNSRVSLKFIEV